MEHSANPMHGRPQPDSGAVREHERLHIVENGLLTTHMARLRDRRTSVEAFRATSNELARIVLWHALQDVELNSTEVEGFAGDPVPAFRLGERVTGVAVLRAGLTFEPAFRALLPESPLLQIGVRRDEETLEPDFYTSNVPVSPGWTDRAIVLDPMLATGGTACAAIEIIRRSHRGPLDVACLVAAPLGVDEVFRIDPSTRIFCAALDERLNDAGFIVPGLGDAGDRYFGTG